LEPKQTETETVSVCFMKPRTFFQFFSMCFGVSDLYRNNRNKQNRLETNKKIIVQLIHIQSAAYVLQADMCSRCSTKDLVGGHVWGQHKLMHAVV
jgi:hypothetical protein